MRPRSFFFSKLNEVSSLFFCCSLPRLTAVLAAENNSIRNREGEERVRKKNNRHGPREHTQNSRALATILHADDRGEVTWDCLMQSLASYLAVLRTARSMRGSVVKMRDVDQGHGKYISRSKSA